MAGMLAQRKIGGMLRSEKEAVLRPRLFTEKEDRC